MQVESLEARHLMAADDPQEWIKDDGAPGYQEVGTGWQNGGLAGGRDGDYRYAPAGNSGAAWIDRSIRVG